MYNATQLVESIMDSLRLALEEEKKLKGVIEHLEQTLKILKGEEAPLVSVSTESQREAIQTTTPEENLKAVMDIIRSNGTPMRRKDIVKRAIKSGLILSKNGPNGVDPLVGNILSRNEPRLFINTGWGWWDLADRQKRINSSSATPTQNQTEPIRFPRVEPTTPSRVSLIPPGIAVKKG